MMRLEGDALRLEGAVTIDNVRGVIEEGRRLLGRDGLAVDLSGLGSVDSAALSMMLEWARDAAAAGHTLRFRNLPENLKSLAKVYGILELLPLEAGDPAPDPGFPSRDPASSP